MLLSMNELRSAQKCRVRVSHHLPAERLAVTVVDGDHKDFVVWALSDLTGNGSFSLTSTLTGRTIALAGLAVSHDAMTFIAPGNAISDNERAKYIVPVIDSFLNLWAGEKVQSIGLCFTSSLGDSSKAVGVFALGGNLENLLPLPESATQLIASSA